MRPREVRVYLLDALAATEEIVAIREQVDEKDPERIESCEPRSNGT